MPTRFIKESCLTSKNLQQVQDFSERLFWRLLTTADDFGRCLACPAIVRASCFPLSLTITIKKIESALRDLAKHHLISLYAVGDRNYAQFCTFEKYQGKPRANKSKYPSLNDVSASICMHLQPVPDMHALPPDTDTDTNTNTDLSSPDPLKSLDSEIHLKSNDRAEDNEKDFESFWMQYPRKVGKKAAQKAWHAAKDKPEIQEVLQAVDQAKRSQQWTKDNGEFIPHPATWLNQGRWADQQTARPLSVVERFLERHKGEA